MKKVILFLILLISIIAIPTNVFADEGPKPSIDVNIKNLNTTNYLVDLFIYANDEKVYKSLPDYNGSGLTDIEIKKLHELNFDGWISISTRWNKYVMFADCAGNKEFKNHFGYFGTPIRYKIVIINNDTGETKITEEIVRKDFNSVVTVDYETMKVVSNNKDLLKTIIIVALSLIFTIIIEIGVAILFKIKRYVAIGITNLATNVALQTALLLLINHYFQVFIIGEILVVLIELLVYQLLFKDLRKKKILLYTLVANLITVIVSFLLYKI